MIFFLHSVFPDDLSFAESRTTQFRSVSRLSGSSGGSTGGTWGPRYSSSSFINGPDDSEGDDERSQSCSLYRARVGAFSGASQESLNSVNPPPQVSPPTQPPLVSVRPRGYADSGLDWKRHWLPVYCFALVSAGSETWVRIYRLFLSIFARSIEKYQLTCNHWDGFKLIFKYLKKKYIPKRYQTVELMTRSKDFGLSQQRR